MFVTTSRETSIACRGKPPGGLPQMGSPKIPQIGNGPPVAGAAGCATCLTSLDIGRGAGAGYPIACIRSLIWRSKRLGKSAALRHQLLLLRRRTLIHAAHPTTDRRPALDSRPGRVDRGSGLGGKERRLRSLLP